jgi:hypothetical protein
MPTRVLVAENGGNHLYAIGRVGLDTGTADDGGVYTGLLRTERISPAGEGGLVHFRRVLLRVWHSGAFAGTLRAYVDETQTQVYSGPVLVDQAYAFSHAAPLASPDETLVEMDVNAVGTFIEVELEVDSDAITGVFLPEVIAVGCRILRPGRQRDAGTT